ncbi:hypothetical protein ACFE04_006881 [Oxalis oulophora]
MSNYLALSRGDLASSMVSSWLHRRRVYATRSVDSRAEYERVRTGSMIDWWWLKSRSPLLPTEETTFLLNFHLIDKPARLGALTLRAHFKASLVILFIYRRSFYYPSMATLPPAFSTVTYCQVEPTNGLLPPIGGILPPIGKILPPIGGGILPPIGKILPPIGGGLLPPIGGGLLPPVGALTCLGPVLQIGSCLTQVVTAVTSQKFTGVGSSCCKAVVNPDLYDCLVQYLSLLPLPVGTVTEQLKGLQGFCSAIPVANL